MLLKFFGQTHSPLGPRPHLLRNAQHPSGLQDLNPRKSIPWNILQKISKTCFINTSSPWTLRCRVVTRPQPGHKEILFRGGWPQCTYVKNVDPFPDASPQFYLFLTPPLWQENSTEHSDQAPHSPQMPSTSWTATIAIMSGNQDNKLKERYHDTMQLSFFGWK